MKKYLFLISLVFITFQATIGLPKSVNFIYSLHQFTRFSAGSEFLSNQSYFTKGAPCFDTIFDYCTPVIVAMSPGKLFLAQNFFECKKETMGHEVFEDLLSKVPVKSLLVSISYQGKNRKSIKFIKDLVSRLKKKGYMHIAKSYGFDFDPIFLRPDALVYGLYKQDGLEKFVINIPDISEVLSMVSK